MRGLFDEVTSENGDYRGCPEKEHPSEKNRFIFGKYFVPARNGLTIYVSRRITRFYMLRFKIFKFVHNQLFHYEAAG